MATVGAETESWYSTDQQQDFKQSGIMGSQRSEQWCRCMAEREYGTSAVEFVLYPFCF